MFVTLFQLANHLVRCRQFDEAIPLYKEVLTHAPDFRPCHENLIYAFKKAGRDQEASQCELVFSRKFPAYSNDVRLSIIVPVHNTLPYLAQCIDSILQQHYQNFELILVDDGSTDGSTELLQQYAHASTKIKLIINHQASGNPGTPRNQALDVVQGRYIGFVDSDDWVDADFFESLMSEALLHDADIAISGGFNNHIAQDCTLRKYHSPHFKAEGIYFADYHESFMIWDKVFKTDMIRQHQIRLGETKAAVDVPFIFKAYYYARNVRQCNQTFGYHYRRETPTSVTVNYRKKSSCDFEFEAYQSIATWAKNTQVHPAFLDMINIKKITSFVYTLKLINPDDFDAFYQRVQTELRGIARETVLKFAEEQKKRWILDDFDAVIRLDSPTYFSQKRALQAVASPAVNKCNRNPVFTLAGERPGVLFFPAWVKSNPYQALFYEALHRKFNLRVAGYRVEDLCQELLLENRASYDFLHLHWLHNFFDVNSPSAQTLTEILTYAKKIGYTLVYTAHNIISHESENRDTELKIRKSIVALFDIVIAQGSLPRKILIEELDVAPEKIQIVYHGTYQGHYEDKIGKREARSALGIADDAFVFLFFGAIRGYKGVLNLIAEFQRIKIDMPKAVLVIAGRVHHPDLLNQIRAYANEDAAIRISAKFIDDDEVQTYFNACDAYVLPYERILSSGSLLLGMTFKKPTIAPQQGVLPELLNSHLGQLFEDYTEMGDIMRNWYEHWTCDTFDEKFPESAFTEFMDKYQWDQTIRNFSLGATHGE